MTQPDNFAPPVNGAVGVYKCREHFHVGVLMPSFDWETGEHDETDLHWSEMGRGSTFEKVCARWAAVACTSESEEGP